MTASGQVAVVLAATSGLLLTGRGGGAAARLRSAGLPRSGSGGGGWVPGPRDRPTGGPAAVPPSWLARCLGVGAAACVLAGRGGPATVLAVGALATWLPGHRAAEDRRRAEQVSAHDLPRVADLLAACLGAGLPVADAAAVVGSAVRGPLGAAVGRAGAALQAGADPQRVWAAAGAPLGPGWSRLVAALERGSASGAPLAGLLRAVADDERDRTRWAAEAAAQRAGVRAIGPLVACYLPAFVLVGVVPVVAGIAGQVVGDLG